MKHHKAISGNTSWNRNLDDRPSQRLCLADSTPSTPWMPWKPTGGNAACVSLFLGRALLPSFSCSRALLSHRVPSRVYNVSCGIIWHYVAFHGFEWCWAVAGRSCLLCVLVSWVCATWGHSRDNRWRLQSGSDIYGLEGAKDAHTPPRSRESTLKCSKRERACLPSPWRKTPPPHRGTLPEFSYKSRQK